MKKISANTFFKVFKENLEPICVLENNDYINRLFFVPFLSRIGGHYFMETVVDGNSVYYRFDNEHEAVSYFE